MSLSTAKNIALGTIISTGIGCGTETSTKVHDIKLLFTDAQLTGEWRIVQYESANLDKKSLEIMRNKPFFATVEFFQTKAQQTKVLMGENIISYQYLNKPIANLKADDKVELTILMRAQEELNEYIANLKIQTEEVF